MVKLFRKAFFQNHILFIWIVAIGLLLRILFIEYQGLSNDELSAWYRIKYNNWDDFWFFGVKSGDMHPFFYQFFLVCWTRFFGESELALRSTGLLFYIVNSYLIYTICNRFFSKNSGLGIVTVYASFVFTIINTTLARPYNSGTFFLLVLFLSILELNRSERKIWYWHLGITLGFLGAMTSHYFAFLTAGIIGFLSIFYLEKNKIKNLLICGGIAILLFLPHWTVTQYQLSQGGLGWLAAPKWNWLIDFFYNFFNSSWIVFLLFILLLFISIFGKKSTKEVKFSIAIFIFTYLFAHFLSIVYTPILRELVMLFILPFLFIFLFRKIDFLKRKHLTIFFVLAPITIGLEGIFIEGMLKPKNFAVFKEIGEKINYWDTKIKIKNNCTTASSYNNIGYINYYLNSPLSESITDWSKGTAVYEIANRAKNSRNNYFLYSWSNSFHTPMHYEVIQKYFPSTIAQESYFGSSFRLYSKKGKRNISPKKIFHFKNNQSGKQEFFGELKFSIKDIFKDLKEDEYVLFSTKGKISNSSPMYYVATIERDGKLVQDDGKSILYQTFDHSKLNQKNILTDFFIAFELPKDAKPNDMLKIYFWNPSKSPVEFYETKLFYQKK